MKFSGKRLNILTQAEIGNLSILLINYNQIAAKCSYATFSSLNKKNKNQPEKKTSSFF